MFFFLVLSRKIQLFDTFEKTKQKAYFERREKDLMDVLPLIRFPYSNWL